MAGTFASTKTDKKPFARNYISISVTGRRTHVLFWRDAIGSYRDVGVVGIRPLCRVLERAKQIQDIYETEGVAAGYAAQAQPGGNLMDAVAGHALPLLDITTPQTYACPDGFVLHYKAPCAELPTPQLRTLAAMFPGVHIEMQHRPTQSVNVAGVSNVVRVGPISS